MAGNVEWPGYERLQKKLLRLAEIPEAAMRQIGETFEEIIVEDNRRGVLAGLDKDGLPLAPVTYRNGVAGKARARGPKGFGRVSGTFKGRDLTVSPTRDPHAHGNLTTAEYKKLTGPPLAPRRADSRVITNLATTSNVAGSTVTAQGAWLEVVSADGVPFLPAHFKGATVGGRRRRFKLKVRNLAGVRPWGIEQARKAVRVWGRMLLEKP